MLREIIETGKTVDAAIDSACEKLGCPRDEIEWEIISLPKKGFLGLVSSPAKVRVSVPVKEEIAPAPQADRQPPARPVRKDPPQREARPAPKAVAPIPVAPAEVKVPQPSQPPQESRPAGDREALAVSYLGDIMKAMGVQAEITSERHEEDMVVNVSGNSLGVMIGRRGETLDAIQYLTGLVVNRLEGDYLRVTIDCGNYRNKRRTTLEALARKIGGQVAKNGKSVTLEPMNPFERRVIHATVSEIKGVTSTSTGEGSGRRVVISSTEPGVTVSAPRNAASRPRTSDKSGDNRRRGGRRGPQPPRLDYLDIKDGGFKSATPEDNSSHSTPVQQSREGARPSVRRDNFVPRQQPIREADPKPESQPTAAPAKTIVDKEIAAAPLYGKIDLE